MKEIILNKIDDLCADFLYYERKEDEELTVDKLNDAVKSGEITIDEMVEKFKENLENTFNDGQ